MIDECASTNATRKATLVRKSNSRDNEDGPMTDHKIEVGGYYKTRCGYPVRIYATDGGSAKDDIHAAYFDAGSWYSFTTYRTGRVGASNNTSLDIMPPEPARPIDVAKIEKAIDSLDIFFACGDTKAVNTAWLMLREIRVGLQ